MSEQRARFTPQFIIDRSISGTKWTFLLAPVGTVLGYATTVLLARMGAEVLGFYGILLIAATLASTFLLYGGSNVIVNFLPRLDGTARGGFLLAYALVCVAFALPAIALLLVVLNAYPDWVRVILGSQATPDLVRYIGLLFPVVLLHTFAQAMLSARMSIREAALVGAIIPVVTFLGIGFAYLNPGAFLAEPFLWIAATILGAHLASLLTAVVVLFRTGESPWHGFVRPSLPQGFWRFSLPFHVNTLLYFLIGQADQLVTFRILGLEDLGLYRAAFATASFVTWFPDRLMGALYPGFCHMVANGDKALLQQAYRKALVAASLLSTMIALPLILFSREVFLLFGRGYTQTSLLPFWVLSAGSALVFPLGAASGTLIVAAGRNDYNMVPNAIGAACAVLLSLLLVGPYGLAGVALARVLAFSVIVLISCMLVRYVLHLHITLSVLPLCALPGISALALGLNLIPAPLEARAAAFAGLTLVALAYVRLTGLVHVSDLRVFLSARQG